MAQWHNGRMASPSLDSGAGQTDLLTLYWHCRLECGHYYFGGRKVDREKRGTTVQRPVVMCCFRQRGVKILLQREYDD